MSKFESDDTEELLLLRTSVDRHWKQRVKDAERQTRRGRPLEAQMNVQDANGLKRLRTRLNRALRHAQKGSE